MNVGDIVEVSAGKYDGKTGEVASVAAKSCTLIIDGQQTGNILFDAVKRKAAKSVAAPKSSSVPDTPKAKIKAASPPAAGSPDSVVTANLHSGQPKVFCLAIGASQDPSKAAIKTAADADVDLREVRFVPRRATATRGDNALPDVIDDVIVVKDWMESAGPHLVDVNRFVGRDDTNSLTRKAFLNKVDRLLEQPGQVFVLYYAGHGTDGQQPVINSVPGAFCMQKDGFVTLEDLINSWVGPQVTARRGQKFVVIADSCHSGALVQQLKMIHRERSREGLPNLNMAVQSACGASELSSGGLFTKPFVEKQMGDRMRFDWKAAMPHPSICGACRKFYTPKCANCALLHSAGYPRTLDEVQHPDYFTTWGGDTVSIDGFDMRFYRRASTK